MGKKNSGRPKGRTSAYAYFMQHCRQELREQSPGRSVAFMAFSRQCARRWQAMGPGDKAPFLRLARADQGRYARQMHSYDPQAAARCDPRAPQRPLSAFLLFVHEYRPQVRSRHPDLTSTQLGQRLGALWRELGAQERRPFQARAAQMQDAYARQMAKYRASKGRGGREATRESESQQDSGCSSHQDGAHPKGKEEMDHDEEEEDVDSPEDEEELEEEEEEDLYNPEDEEELDEEEEEDLYDPEDEEELDEEEEDVEDEETDLSSDWDSDTE